MTHTNINWHLDPRVTPILRGIARDGIGLESYRGYSVSSWGEKAYTKPTSRAFGKLCAIWNEYCDRVYAEDESAFAAFLDLPRPEPLARFAAGMHMEMPHLDLTATDKRAAYLDECAKAMPGGFDRREVAA